MFDGKTLSAFGTRVGTGHLRPPPSTEREPGQLVFPSTRPGAMMGNVVMTQALRNAGVAASGRGFRSSFRDYAAEQTHTPHAVMEAALAHVVRNKAEAAYARSDLFEKRRG